MGADKLIIYSAVQLEEIREMLAGTGYEYDPRQDIFYSTIDPWQRKLGYCSLYDEAAIPLGMVFDCEPVRFKYGGKNWMIELWKGQYGITTGGEIGVYTTTGPIIEIPGIFNGTLYFCADDSDNLSMTYTLLKNNEVMFSRAARHWWLTGFRLGEYADPEDLTMEASITLKDAAMRDAFLAALHEMGYGDNEVRSGGNTVLILFREPHSRQPFTRTGIIGDMALQGLKNNVDIYKSITGGINSIYDIFMLIKQTPQLFDLVLGMGRKKEIADIYEAIAQKLRT
ncbi:MAG: DUF4474 domain-containing protein [Clostridiales bacterium]|nr:DUF4474 domain-containing protein [Clostridiales bacterium]